LKALHIGRSKRNRFIDFQSFKLVLLKILLKNSKTKKYREIFHVQYIIFTFSKHYCSTSQTGFRGGKIVRKTILGFREKVLIFKVILALTENDV
jgi:hypothetical protein